MTSTANPTLNPNLKEFWQTKARNKILYGGRSSSKSWDTSGVAIYLASKYKMKFLCVRQIQNKITDSVYSLLKIQIERFGLKDEFTVLKNSIIHNITGSEFLFYGLWRSVDEIKSIESVDILWSEESHALTEEQWNILEPSIRKEGSECWILFNPKLVTDFVYKRFIINTPPNTIKRHINYNENPFLSETMINIIEAVKAEDEDKYNHIYLGHPKVDDNEAIIKRSWIEAAIDSHLKLNIEISGKKRIGYDIADSGEDSCAIIETHGIYTYYSSEWFAKEDELEESAEKVYKRASSQKLHITYDSIGVGASAGSTFKRLNLESKVKIQYSKFNAGDKVRDPDKVFSDNIKNRDMFSNLKAQSWWEMAQRFKNTYNAVTKGTIFKEDEIISISSDLKHLDQLMEELSTPRKNEDNTGKVKVESKKDLKRRGIKSPNIADAFLMAYSKPKVNSLLASMREN